MRRNLHYPLLVFLVVGCSFSGAQQVPAQQARTVRVGVYAEEYRDHTTLVNSTANARNQRDLIVNYLNRHKPDKNNALKLEAVPITTTSYNAINSEAHNKRCEYVVRVWGNGWVRQDAGNSSFHSPENSFQPESGVPPNGLVTYSVGFSLLRAGDNAWLDGETYSQLQPQSTPAMSVMNSVYKAIVKAANP